jgi:Na+-exporting ATPase
MSVIYDKPGAKNSMIFTKGAVERIIDLCSSCGSGSTQQPMTDKLKVEVLKRMDTFAQQGQRVLAIASREWNGNFRERMGKEEKNGKSSFP